ncbi:MAG: RNA 2',3'-cyclic phosphodiesterase, partial [Chloroflexota bacterium]
AVRLPESVRTDLVHAAAPLHDALPNVRWVRAEALHLTLVFLGEQPADQVEPIARAMDTAARERQPFVLIVGGNGCFPSAERARVLWTGLAGDIDALIALQRAVLAALVDAHLVEADYRFSPHLTIGRLRDGTPPPARAAAGRRWTALPAPAPTPIPVEEIHLIRSELLPHGPRHTTLHRSILTRGR